MMDQKVEPNPVREARLDELIADSRVNLAMWRHEPSRHFSRFDQAQIGQFVARFREDPDSQFLAMQWLHAHLCSMLHSDWFLARLADKVSAAEPIAPTVPTEIVTPDSDYLPRPPIQKQPSPSSASVFASRIARLTECVAGMSDAEFEAMLVRLCPPETNLKE